MPKVAVCSAAGPQEFLKIHGVCQLHIQSTWTRCATLKRCLYGDLPPQPPSGPYLHSAHTACKRRTGSILWSSLAVCKKSGGRTGLEEMDSTRPRWGSCLDEGKTPSWQFFMAFHKYQYCNLGSSRNNINIFKTKQYACKNSKINTLHELMWKNAYYFNITVVLII